MAGGFEFLEHTADVYIKAWGDSLEEAFEWAAIAMFEVMTDINKVEPKEKHQISVKAEDLLALLYEWLEELLFIFGSKGIVFSKFKVHNITQTENDMYMLIGKAWGEPFNVKKHDQRTEVKAVTYSLMEINKSKDLNQWVIKFVLDI